jgi:hypothetical protein
VSRTGDFGEVLAVREGSGSGGIELSWAPRPDRLSESDHFAPPGLMLDYSGLGPAGLEGPVSAQILVSRVTDPLMGPPPALDSLIFRMTAPSGEPMVWTWRERREAERRLAEWMVRSSADAKARIIIDIQDPSGAVLARSAFDIRVSEQVLKVLRDAVTEANALERSLDGGCRRSAPGGF